jgi:hypothetical protein
MLWERHPCRDEPTSPKQVGLRRLNRGWKPLPQKKNQHLENSQLLFENSDGFVESFKFKARERRVARRT